MPICPMMRRLGRPEWARIGERLDPKTNVVGGLTVKHQRHSIEIKNVNIARHLYETTEGTGREVL